MKISTDPLLARVQVAADVALLVCSGALVPHTGFVFGLSTGSKFHNAPKKDSAKTLLKKIVSSETPCHVCAKGALITSHILRFNQYKIDELIQMNLGARRHELPEFSTKMMAEIEVLFEGKVHWWNGDLFSQEETAKLIPFAEEINSKLTERNRLLYIMGLIVQSGGRKVFLEPTE